MKTISFMKISLFMKAALFTKAGLPITNKVSIMVDLPISSAAKAHFSMIPAVLLILCGGLTLSACQKTPDSEITAETQTDLQSTPVTTSIDESQNSGDAVVTEQSAKELTSENEQDVDLSQLENDIAAEALTPNAETNMPTPEQVMKGTQITDVHYRSTTGDSLSVVFETSAAGVLNAIVTLPNKSKITLSAPEGQGNNPTYRSTDGKIELISHGGGSTIDLMQNNKITSFEAISAEAEVITQL